MFAWRFQRGRANAFRVSLASERLAVGRVRPAFPETPDNLLLSLEPVISG